MLALNCVKAKHHPAKLHSMSTPSRPPLPQDQKRSKKQDAYWVNSLRIVILVLSLWLFVSLGCGVVFRQWLDSALPNVGGAPFGFWMAQQGAIIGFLILLVLYMVMMNALDRKSGFGPGDRR